MDKMAELAKEGVEFKMCFNATFSWAMAHKRPVLAR